jgi:hypothetical protein
MKRIHVVLGIRSRAFICSVIVFGCMFVFLFLHQVQTQQTFRVTVSRFGAFLDGYPWRIHIEQLSYRELKNVEVRIDEGTIMNCACDFPSPSGVNPKTIDGRAQTEFYLSWQPHTITMVWDEGYETFVFNPCPFA